MPDDRYDMWVEERGRRLDAEAEIQRLRLHANSARVLLERHRVAKNPELLSTALQELDDAMSAAREHAS